ncbi:MAG TPA: GDP-mannose 4,6-dehydratase [Patescibacteria group bacterium]|nr:GDP-mannose 4,6-dehydratase [Patescibacteria group bacterium]
MKVLMTGADGFIGSNVLEFLLEHTDWDFTCICSWRHKGNPLNVKPDPRVHIVTHDLTGVIPDLGNFDYILNLASESHVDRSISEPVHFVENNVSSTLQVLEYARKHKPKVFIQFSTDEVYGATNHAEWDVLLPSNPYSASKAAQEMIAIAYWKTYGLPIVITNSNNIVGRNQDPEKFVPKIVRLIRDGKQVIIHTSKGKPGTRYYNPVENVADALLFIINNYPFKKLQKDRPTRFNLPGGEELNNLEMAKLIAQQLKKPLKYKLVDVASIRPGYDEFYPKTAGEITKLGWKPPLTLQKSLEWLTT